MKQVPPWLIDAGLITVAASDAFMNRSENYSWIVAVISLAALAGRRKWPIPAFALTLPALVINGITIPTLIALYSVGERIANRYVLTGCGVLTAIGYAFPGLNFTFLRLDTLMVIIYAVMAAAAPLFLGRLVRTRKELALRLEEVRQAREHEEILGAQALLAKERNQLAREMHDVVSHQVSLIAVQAGALGVSTNDVTVKNAAEKVRRLSVDTLDELRHMVNLLRASGTQATELTPQPTLSDLERLVSGSGIEARLTGEVPDGLDNAVQRTIYRTVQEGLTNVRKHAPGGCATIEFGGDESELTVTVTNTPPTRPTLALPSDRHGLAGLQERAALLGGSVESGKLPDGGFRLRLSLPLDR
ncbi:sensor histidine kinase [Amycolatopsis jejuensis]|uniref:sensor histidine kinase n=1 Tax=Amycolatopsis jejuensis TaxID=330084 RepID=UPI0005264672|nr:histidine kinase [Amycolatopsis jejuensis]